MSLDLFNTLSRQKEEFKPLQAGQVGLYTCGPTVYAAPHLGNLRTYIFEDILKRTLLANDYKVKHVMNITDVGHLVSDADEGEDKMEKGSRATGKTVWEIATEFTQEFKNNLVDLNILPPDIYCPATDYISEQIDLIKKLEAKGFTYVIPDGVYFDTSKLSDYGKLARLDLEGLKAGARVEIASGKKNITDFALWKLSYSGGRSFDPAQDDAKSRRQMEWDSPWGKGFPGWHIECSAMSMKYLGEIFDIHCGGIDHIPVHHTNEIAQSEAVTGKVPANFWMHGEFMVVDEKRMGKSEGNAMTLDWLKEQNISPLEYRYFCLGTHYRKPLSFSLEAIVSASKALKNIQAKVATMVEVQIGCAELEQKFKEAINDDLNTPQALAVVWEVLKSNYPDGVKKASLLKIDEVLGLGLKDIKLVVIPPAVQTFADEREQARHDKDFTKADVIRQSIKELGFTVDDTDFGPVIKKL